jgi:glycosyltransferase involved in cell wall biosynthesis
MPDDRQPRLLIFVIAYFAERTLTSVLERIPCAIFRDYNCEVLVVDDASDDRTNEIGRVYRSALGKGGVIGKVVLVRKESSLQRGAA